MGCKYRSLVIHLLLFSLIILYLPTSIIQAENNSAQYYGRVSVGVERRVEFLSGGYIRINDTFTLSLNISESESQPTGATAYLTDYTVGVPKNYSNNLVYYSAHDFRGEMLITALEDEGGFLWLKLSFPEPITLAGDGIYNFTVTYVFSDMIRREAGRVFRAEFPLYPSLREEAAYCNVTVVFPSAASVSESDYPSDVFINKTSDNRILCNSTSPLMAYANISSWARFSSTTFSLLKFLNMRREINIEGWGKISVTDFYEISVVNNNVIGLNLPSGASGIVVYDAYGQYEKSNIIISEMEDSVSVKVILGEKLTDYGGGRIAVSYTLPFWKYIVREGWQNYILNINLTKPDEWVIDHASIIIVLPEGASIIQENGVNLASSKVGLFQERVAAEYYRVTRYQSLGLSIKYQYMILWAAFRPTLLASAIAGIIGLAAITVRFMRLGRVRAVIPAAHVPPETLKRFIETYEEKIRIISEIDSLDQQSRRGKISRRHYRLQRRLLEERLSNIQKGINELKADIESAGGHYTDLMRRLEAASANIETVKRSIAEVEIRYARGEISAETRRRLIEEYERRKRESEIEIDDVLLSLKEEIS
ncbi:MAG: hypothetical protein QW804_00725 [Candidatus Bathyarchaeia archaeon]|nr:hypothetical protein [Candidatus Bathyarchaeota archaeon]